MKALSDNPRQPGLVWCGHAKFTMSHTSGARPRCGTFVTASPSGRSADALLTLGHSALSTQHSALPAVIASITWVCGPPIGMKINHGGTEITEKPQ